jgi:arginase
MNIQLIKNRSDIGAGTRGSDMGIDAMEIASINKGDDFFHRHDHVDVETHNESIYNKNTNPFAKRIEHVFEQCERVADAVRSSIKTNHFPIVLSGDHSSALGTISGIKAANPHHTLGVIWLDAHADLHSPYTSPSGNIHGMPLAAVLGMDNLEHQLNPIEAATEYFWSKVKNIGIEGPKLRPDHLAYFGLRDFEHAEEALIRQQGILHYRVDEMREKKISACVETCLKQLQDCDIIYISFDVDSMDCDSISYVYHLMVYYIQRIK